MISWEQEGEYLRIRLDRAQGPMSGGNAGVWLFACLQDAACLARAIQLVKSTVLASCQVSQTHHPHYANAEGSRHSFSGLPPNIAGCNQGEEGPPSEAFHVRPVFRVKQFCVCLAFYLRQYCPEAVRWHCNYSPEAAPAWLYKPLFIAFRFDRRPVYGRTSASGEMPARKQVRSTIKALFGIRCHDAHDSDTLADSSPSDMWGHLLMDLDCERSLIPELHSITVRYSSDTGIESVNWQETSSSSSDLTARL